MPNFRVDPVRPVHGDYITGFKITEGKERMLATRWRAFELGIFERVRTDTPARLPGVKVYDLFEASMPTISDPPSLADAQALNPHYQRFLVSMAGEGLAVVTSRIGYERTGDVMIPTSPYLTAHVEIDMCDLDRNIDDETLMREHAERVAHKGGQLALHLSQEFADGVFREMKFRAPEVR